MRTSFFRLRYQLGWKDALRVMWKAETNRFEKLKVDAFKHPIYFRSFKEDYGIFDFILVSKDYNFRLPFAPKTILDAGGNIGMASVWFANRYPDAKIVSIEPSAYNYPWLVKNTKEYKNVTTHLGGLWGKPAHLELVDNGRGHSSFEVREVAAPGENTLRAYSIPELMEMHGWDQIDILKLDIEGSEKNVIMTEPEKWLPKTKFIAVEFHDRRLKDTSKEFFKVITKYNFSMEPLKECLLFYNEDLVEMFAPYHEK